MQQGEPQVVSTFEELDLKPDLLKGLEDFGYEKPTLVQRMSLASLIKQKDMIVYSPGNSGKTVSYLIGCLQIIDQQLSACQVIIISPTREVALIIYKLFLELNEHLNIKGRLIIRGNNVRQDRVTLRKGGIQLVIGTAGRINDLITRRFLAVDWMKRVILDEADEIFWRGFEENVKDIFSNLPCDVTICCFAEREMQYIKDHQQKFMRDPVVIQVPIEQLVDNRVLHYYITVQNNQKKNRFLVECLDISLCMIYVDHPTQAIELERQLNEHNLTAKFIPEDAPAEELRQIQKELLTLKLKAIIVVDSVEQARIQSSCALVIYYDMPNFDYPFRKRSSTYISSKKYNTSVIFLVTPEQSLLFSQQSKSFGVKMDELPVNSKEILKH